MQNCGFWGTQGEIKNLNVSIIHHFLKNNYTWHSIYHLYNNIMDSKDCPCMHREGIGFWLCFLGGIMFPPYFLYYKLLTVLFILLIPIQVNSNLFFYYSYFFFIWRIIALQDFVVFCQTSTWISHRYVHIYSLPFEPTSHVPPHPSPLDWYRVNFNLCIHFYPFTSFYQLVHVLLSTNYHVFWLSY